MRPLENSCGCENGIHVHVGALDVASFAPKGPREKYVVSASVPEGRPICRGEFVQRVGEYVPLGEELRFALEDVHILDAAELSQGRVGVVFAQGGQTKFKILALENGALALGNTLVLLEDEALEAARVVEVRTDRALVAYNRDAAGVAAVVDLNGRVAALAYTDLWDDDVENICACALSGERVVLSGMRQNANNAGEAWAVCAQVGDTALTLGSHVRVDGGNDVDVYAGGWDMCRADDDAAVLCYHQGLNKPVGFAVLDTQKEKYTDRDLDLAVRLIGECKYAETLPALAAAGLDGGRWLVAYGAAVLTPDRQVVKSALAVEVWGLTRYAAELLWYGCEGERFAASIGAVGAEPNGVGAAITYTGEDVARSIYAECIKGPYAGPGTPLGGHGGFCRVVPISTGKALLVSQREGCGYVQAMEAQVRVIAATRLADGKALSGGGAGEEITVEVVGAPAQ